ncbi:unnamed protein product [Leuciscus chuanchicus]
MRPGGRSGICPHCPMASPSLSITVLFSTGIRPNDKGSFPMRISVKIDRNNSLVTHSSLTEPVSVNWGWRAERDYRNRRRHRRRRPTRKTGRRGEVATEQVSSMESPGGSPDVHMFVSKSPDDESKLVLSCLATGFYPRDVQMNIRLNRINLEDQTSGIRPNDDETFQMRISVKIDRNHEGSYDCLVHQAKALKDLHEGGHDPQVLQELRIATDLALRATKVTARSVGRAMSTLVVQERHLWLCLADMRETDKLRFLNSPVSQTGLFGDAVENFAQQFSAVQKQTEAIRHILPRRPAAAPTPPPAAPQSARRRGRPPASAPAPAPPQQPPSKRRRGASRRRAAPPVQDPAKRGGKARSKRP